MKRLAVLLIAACGLPTGDVLAKKTAPVFSSCDDALANAVDGSACAGIDVCSQTATCCKETVICESGVVFRKKDCASCAPCGAGESCDPGTRCVDQLCQPCTEPMCPECPAGQKQQTINGCLTCECG